jgi:aromatic amino acid aminotransferase I
VHEVAKAFNDFAGVKSYLSRDIDGRVVRVDTFSKVAGPGLRLGWVTANEAFAERILRIGTSFTYGGC